MKNKLHVQIIETSIFNGFLFRSEIFFQTTQELEYLLPPSEKCIELLYNYMYHRSCDKRTLKEGNFNFLILYVSSNFNAVFFLFLSSEKKIFS
jgi:hypothetical protein